MLAAEPSMHRGETTDKGYINQRAVLANRADRVAELHHDPAAAHVLLVD